MNSVTGGEAFLLFMFLLCNCTVERGIRVGRSLISFQALVCPAHATKPSINSDGSAILQEHNARVRRGGSLSPRTLILNPEQRLAIHECSPPGIELELS